MPTLKQYLSVALAALLAILASEKPASAQPKLAMFCEGKLSEASARGSTRLSGSSNAYAEVCFYGDAIERDDVVHATLYKGAKKIAKTTCKGNISQLSVEYGSLKDASKDKKHYFAQCRFDDGPKKAGNYSIKFDYQSMEDEKTHKNVAALQLVVKKEKLDYRSQWDNVVGPVFITYAPKDMRSTNHTKSEAPRLWIWTHIKTPWEGSSPDKIGLRCRLNGKTVYVGDTRTSNGKSTQEWRVDALTFHAQHFQNEQYSREKPPHLRENRAEFPFGENPGKYECKLQIDGTLYRKFSFVVDKDGLIADKCGPALGVDAAHVIVNDNKATADYKFDKKLAKKNLMFLPKVPKACKSLF